MQLWQAFIIISSYNCLSNIVQRIYSNRSYVFDKRFLVATIISYCMFFWDILSFERLNSLLTFRMLLQYFYACQCFELMCLTYIVLDPSLSYHIWRMTDPKHLHFFYSFVVIFKKTQTEIHRIWKQKSTTFCIFAFFSWFKILKSKLNVLFGFLYCF